MGGHLVTARRRVLLDLIRGAGGHVDAKELYRRATSQGESISLATVYRGLRLFKALGLVDERRLGQLGCYYEIRRPVDHQHLVCQGCGKVIEFQSPLMRRLIDQVQHDHNFSVAKTELYLQGYCQECKWQTEDSGR